MFRACVRAAFGLSFVLLLIFVIVMSGAASSPRMDCAWLPIKNPYRQYMMDHLIMTCSQDGRYIEWADFNYYDPPFEREIEGIR